MGSQQRLYYFAELNKKNRDVTKHQIYDPYGNNLYVPNNRFNLKNKDKNMFSTFVATSD